MSFKSEQDSKDASSLQKEPDWPKPSQPGTSQDNIANVNVGSIMGGLLDEANKTGQDDHHIISYNNRDLTDDDIAELKNLLKEGDDAQKANNDDVYSSILEEILEKFGITGVFPRIVVLGMEKTGKSSLVVALLDGLNINYCAVSRATVAPLLVMVRKNRKLQKGQFRCKIEFKSDRRCNVPLHEAARNIKAIMQNIESASYFDFTPVKLLIESGNPETRCISYIDLPGMITNDTKHTDPSVREMNVNGLRDITHSTLKQLKPIDIALFVTRSTDLPSSTTILNHVPVELRTSGSIFVTTHADRFINQSRESCENFIQEWERVAADVKQQKVTHASTPNFYMVALHESTPDPENEHDIATQQAAINQQLREKENQVTNTLGDVPRYKLSALKDELHSRRSQVSLDNFPHVSKIIRTIRNKCEIEANELALALGNNSYSNPNSLVRDIFRSFCQEFNDLFKGIQSRTATTIIEGERLARGMDSEIPKSLHSWPMDIQIENTFQLKDIADIEDLVREHAEFCDMFIVSGSKRLHRLKSEMQIRTTAIELEDPSDNIIVDLMVSTTGTDSYNPVSAAGQGSRKVSGTVFQDRGVEYLQARIQHIFRDLVETVLRVIWSRYPALESEAVNGFKWRFQEIVNNTLDGIVDNEIAILKKNLQTAFSATPAKMASYFEAIPGFIHGRTNAAETKEGEVEKDEDGFSDCKDDADNNTVVHNTKRRASNIERFNPIQRISVLSRKNILANYETAVISVQAPNKQAINQAKNLFFRYFSAHRELFSLLLSMCIHGIQEAIIGPNEIESFSGTLEQNIFKIEDKHGSRLRTDEELQQHVFIEFTDHKQKLEDAHCRKKEKIKALDHLIRQIDHLKLSGKKKVGSVRNS